MSYDQYFFPNVVSLLRLDGVNDGTVFGDMNNARVWTRVGNLVTKTAQKKFASASGYFDGAGDYLSCPASEDFNFGTGAFTIEAWVYVSGNSATDGGGIRSAVICSTMSANLGGFAYGVTGDGTTTGTGVWWEDKTGAVQISGNWTTPVSQNGWHHVCVSRAHAGTDIYLGLDGTLQATAISGGASRALGANAYPMWVGGQNVSSWNRYLLGYLTDFRVTKGVARYTGSTYTVPTEALPGWKENPATPGYRVSQTCKSQLMTNQIGIRKSRMCVPAGLAFTSRAVDFGDISGTITEETAYSKWRLLVSDAVTGEPLGTREALGSSYRILVAKNRPVMVTCSPYLDGRWNAQAMVRANELWVPSNAGATPYVYRCTTAGRTGTTEPIWGTTPGGTTSDGTVVWTCLARLPQPATQGPLVAT